MRWSAILPFAAGRQRLFSGNGADLQTMRGSFPHGAFAVPGEIRSVGCRSRLEVRSNREAEAGMQMRPCRMRSFCCKTFEVSKTPAAFPQQGGRRIVRPIPDMPRVGGCASRNRGILVPGCQKRYFSCLTLLTSRKMSCHASSPKVVPTTSMTLPAVMAPMVPHCRSESPSQSPERNPAA